ncbi:MAG: acetyl/propionyl/methylcrotonyl-CoA carboxylase subunit alpha [Pseudomonadota bacterium]
MLKKILIANRGEIACRVIRTARRLGIATVAVHSDADAHAQHRLQADESVHLPGTLPRDTYLVIEKIIAAARLSGADAIHPGYGFLSENAAFAQACRDAGIVFIGPPPSAIEAMGSKSAAKRLMENAGVPLVPGYHGKDQHDALLLKEAKRIGFPVLLKAAAGGGGKGMRAVMAETEFAAALASARREAANSFGDDTMLVEKYLQQPRHVEVQVFCDSHGNGVYLFERDCSIQRRHQKIVEEAPAPGMTPALRRKMGEAAVKAAQAIGYEGAGTIEFLLDVTGDFYFMEMNTRLQVEHPVTEYITGQDLVEWQIRVASGGRLPLTQEALRIDGHAIEVRICAEDADHEFLPSTGRLALFVPPHTGTQVRLDTGVIEGDTITPFYDPMIAKLICHGSTRDEAIDHLTQALRETRIAGPACNVAFLHRVVSSAPFRAADLDTRFLERHAEQLQADAALIERAVDHAARYTARTARSIAGNGNDSHSPWDAVDHWEAGGERMLPVMFQHDGKAYRRRIAVHTADATPADPPPGHAGAVLHRVGDALHVWLQGEQIVLQLPGHGSDDGHAGDCRAPMHGRIVALLAEAGTPVKRGDPLLVMEAMKMEHTLRAPHDGTLHAFLCAPGSMVEEGSTLVTFAEGGA